MNTLFAGFINAFLALLLTQNTVGENDGDGAQGRDFLVGHGVTLYGHVGLYPATPRFFSIGCRGFFNAQARDCPANEMFDSRTFVLIE